MAGWVVIETYDAMLLQPLRPNWRRLGMKLALPGLLVAAGLRHLGASRATVFGWTVLAVFLVLAGAAAAWLAYQLLGDVCSAQSCFAVDLSPDEVIRAAPPAVRHLKSAQVETCDELGGFLALHVHALLVEHYG